MNRFKTSLKVFGGCLGLLILAALVFIGFNFTLVKNLPSSRDGGMDAMYIANQQPLQIISGSNPMALSHNPVDEKIFEDAKHYWAETGGKALLVWHQGSLVYEIYADGVEPEDRSRSFSMHKSVVGLVAATLEAQGHLNLDDPVSLYVDEYKSGGREALTLRQMLQHQTGLERFAFTPPSLKTLNLLLSDKIEKTALEAKKISSSDTFDYSNLGYQVAGAAIRRAIDAHNGQSYAQYLSDTIWTPIGAMDAALWSETETGAPRFYAGLQASPRDWLKLGVMIARNDGTIVPKSAIANWLEPSQANAGYGLGVWLGSPEDGVREYGPSTPMTVPSSEPFLIDDMVFFDGFGGQRVYISQTAELVIVRIGDVRFDWDDTALPNLVSQALKRDRHLFNQRIETHQSPSGRDIEFRILEPLSECEGCDLVVFSHGAFASYSDYDAIVAPLVLAGYRIAMPLHYDSAQHPKPHAYPPDMFTHLRLEDVNIAVKNYLGRSDPMPKWILAGHSFGAMIAHIYGGADAGHMSNELDLLLKPSRIIALSPPGLMEPLYTRHSISELSTPSLIVTGDQDIVPGMIEDWQDHLQAHHASPKGLSTAVIFEGRDHYFNGLYGRIVQRPSDAQDRELVRVIVNFLDDKPIDDGDGYAVLEN